MGAPFSIAVPQGVPADRVPAWAVVRDKGQPDVARCILRARLPVDPVVFQGSVPAWARGQASARGRALDNARAWGGRDWRLRLRVKRRVRLVRAQEAADVRTTRRAKKAR